MFKINKHIRPSSYQEGQLNIKDDEEFEISSDVSNSLIEASGALQYYKEIIHDNMSRYLVKVNYEKAEQMAQECREGLFQNCQSWMATEMMILHLQEIEYKAKIHYFLGDEIEDVNSNIEGNSKGNGIGCKSLDRITHTNQVIERFSPKSMQKANFEFEQMIDEIHQASKYERQEGETELAILLLERYRLAFQYFIRCKIVPCDEEIKSFLRQILRIRREEGELLSLASASSNEILIVAENLSNNEYDEYWRTRFSKCTLVYKNISMKHQKVEKKLRTIESKFVIRMKNILYQCDNIEVTGHEIMGLYRHFYEINAYHLSFTFKDLHQFTHFSGFERMIWWYSELNADKFRDIVTEDLGALIDSHMLFGRMIQSICHELSLVCRSFGSSLLFELAKASQEDTLEECMTSTSGLTLDTTTRELTADDEKPHKRKRNIFRGFRN